MRDFGVCEKVDEHEANAQYQVTPVDAKWVDTGKAFEGESVQIRSRIVAREFKSDGRSDLYAGTSPLEVLKAIISIAAHHKETFSIMHIDVSRVYFNAKAQKFVLVRLPVEDGMGADAGKIGWRHQLALFCQERNLVSGMTDRTSDRIRKHHDRGVSNQGKTHYLRVNGKHQSNEQKVALEKARNCVSARSHTCRRARERPWTCARTLRANTSDT